MDLNFSTACLDLYEDGCAVFKGWLEQFPKDPILQGVYDPVVAYDGHTPVGLFEVTYDYFEEVKWVQTIWIHPEFRTRGFGSMVLGYLVETCNYPTIKLFAANHSAPFYEKHGFKNTHGSYYEREIHE